VYWADAAPVDAAAVDASWVATMHDDEMVREEAPGLEVGIMDRTALDRHFERVDALLLLLLLLSVPDGGIVMIRIQAGRIESRY